VTSSVERSSPSASGSSLMKPALAAARSNTGTGTSMPCHGVSASALAGSTPGSVSGGGRSRAKAIDGAGAADGGRTVASPGADGSARWLKW